MRPGPLAGHHLDGGPEERQRRGRPATPRPEVDTVDGRPHVGLPTGFAGLRAGTSTILAALSTATVLVIAFVDIFAFYRADIIQGAINGTVPGVDLAIDQTFLVGATAYVLPAILMIPLTLLMPARGARPVTLVLSLLYGVSIVALAVGKAWTYYLLGSGVEVALLLAIAVLAWRWPRTVS